jgi:cardiolipin synthase
MPPTISAPGTAPRGEPAAWSGALHGARRLAAWPAGLLSRHAGAGAPTGDAHAALRRRHARLLMRTLRRPLVGGNHVELLIDGPATHAAMFAAIDAARDHINLESYIIEADGPGEELARRLIAKRAEGVKVNLLYDGFGSLRTRGAYFEALRRAGVQLCEYNALSSWRRIFNRAVHWRDHRKLMVVDGRVAFIGGVNISDVYSAGSAAQPSDEGAASPPWRDTHLRIAGPLVAELQQLFMSHWNQHAGRPIQAAYYLPPQRSIGPVRAAVASCEAGRRRNPFYRALLKAIDGAQQRVLLTTAYFVPTRRLLRALAAAARRGVAVHLLLPSESDAWAPLHAGRSHYGRLLQAGVHIHERQGALLHAKTSVIDGVWAAVGSANLDWRSVLHNAEANAVVIDQHFGAQMEAVFDHDLAASREVMLADWHRRGFLRRMKEALARRFEFLL